RGAFALVATAVSGFVLRSAGLGRVVSSFHSPSLTIAGAVLGGGGVVLLLGLLLTLPLAGVVRWAFRKLGANGFDGDADQPARIADAPPSKEAAPARIADAPAGEEPAPAPEKPTAGGAGPRRLVARRAVLEAAVATLPVAALGVGGAGIVGAFRPTSIVPRPMAFADLPDGLAGLRILQLTDLHLGAFMDPDGLADLVDRASSAKPDLVVVTGDLSDYLPWVPEALARIETLSPRLGTFAVFGNHEHYRGADEVRRAYERSRIDLLTDEHRILQIGKQRVTLVGVDDPAGYAKDPDFYARHADRALAGAPSDGFRLALCHRPSGFRALASRNVDLTLSGHTHGAQLGNGERSLLDGITEDSFLWGRYALGSRQLYTSSGGGHWLAFRLDCPSEAALVTLEKA
ncbi:MAG TPA: metallophosphoesterase, partial [Polyangiaceae bacterium]|nr:metallophosphoesterase [Polyangiaceae bacterium]